MLAQLGKTTVLILLIAAPAAARAGDPGYDRYGGGYQSSAYGSESYGAASRVEEETYGATGVIAPDGRPYVTHAYSDGYAAGDAQGAYDARQEAYGPPPYDRAYDDSSYEDRRYEDRPYPDRREGWAYGESYGGGYGPPPGYPPAPGYGPPCPAAVRAWLPPCAPAPRPHPVQLGDGFFGGGGGVGPAYISGGGGGGGFYYAGGGGMVSAGARAGAYASASASARASARVSISGGGRGHGGKGGCGCR